MNFHAAEKAWQTYRGEWTAKQVAHLYRRAGFAASPSQLAEGEKQSAEKCVDALFQVEEDQAKQFEKQMKTMGATILASRATRSLSAWWLYRMRYTPDQLLEKTCLFWHGHFATSAEKVDDPQSMLNQNRILRDGSLGKFEPLVQQIATDPAMLIYLDSTDNRKTRPNENFARELMELFCLETGNYSEKDIKELSRCFTGWEVRRKRFRFNPYQHDEGTKTFLGSSGKYDGKKAIQVVLEQEAAPRFLAKKLYRYFVADEPLPEKTLLEPLARQLRQTDFDIGKCIRTILCSNYFYSNKAYARKIKSPIEFALGLMRGLNASANLQQLADRLEQLGQIPFYPPNVKGWDGGRTWINSSTLLGRANLVRDLVHGSNTKWRDGDLARWLSKNDMRDEKSAVEFILKVFVATEIPSAAKAKLVRLAKDQGIKTHSSVADLVHAISLLPEFQLG